MGLSRHISKGIIFCICEPQLWSGNESIEIRYVNGSFVAGTSASLPGVVRHILSPFSKKKMAVPRWSLHAQHIHPDGLDNFSLNLSELNFKRGKKLQDIHFCSIMK